MNHELDDEFDPLADDMAADPMHLELPRRAAPVDKFRAIVGDEGYAQWANEAKATHDRIAARRGSALRQIRRIFGRKLR